MTPPVLVIGAGPAGLASMACLKERGVKARFVDREGLLGGAYRRLYPATELASPARWTSLPGLPIEAASEYITVADYSRYLQGYAAHFDLQAEQAEVISLTQNSKGYEVSFADGDTQDYATVITATGMDGLVWPDYAAKDNPAWIHSSQWQGPEPYKGQRMLVIGRGVSAVEIAEESVRVGIQVVVSCRGKVAFGPKRVLGRDVHDFAYRLSWLPLWLARAYCRKSPTFTGYDQGFRIYQREGKIEVRPTAKKFEGKKVHFADGTRGEFDVVVCATGYRYAMPYLPSTVARSQADDHPLAKNGESTNHPGLFFMGVHCTRSVSSQFLRGMALDAPSIADRVCHRMERR